MTFTATNVFWLPLLLMLALCSFSNARSLRKNPSPAIVDSQIASIVAPYMNEAIKLQKYAWNHPEEFSTEEFSASSSSAADYYAEGASWVLLQKDDVNTVINNFRKAHRRLVIGQNLEVDDDTLFLKIDDTNLFDGLL